MIEHPKRLSLIDQATTHLRQRIESGEWPRLLPGERKLCAELGISRPTLRSALKILEREGWLRSEPNRSREIVRRRKRRIRAGHKVTILFGNEVSLEEGRQQAQVEAARAALRKHQIESELIALPQNEGASLSHFLDTFDARRDNHSWVLMSVPEMVQRWFADNGVPALVSGSLFPGVTLPSLDVDNRATCRHAAGHLISRGCRSLALIGTNRPRAGDLASEAGFIEAIEQSTQPSIHHHIIRTALDPDDIARQLDSAFRHPNPPTGLVVCHSARTLAAVNHCQKSGRRIPDDVAIVSRDHDYYLNYLRPSISAYHFNNQSFARKFANLVLELDRQNVNWQQKLIVPTFVEGDSSR